MADWIFAIAFDDLREGELRSVRVAHADVLLVHLANQEIHAYDNHCPHAGARLSEGELQASTLRCPRHHWEFDIRTGGGINPKFCKLRRYPVKIVDGEVLVQVSPLITKRPLA